MKKVVCIRKEELLAKLPNLYQVFPNVKERQCEKCSHAVLVHPNDEKREAEGRAIVCQDCMKAEQFKDVPPFIRDIIEKIMADRPGEVTTKDITLIKISGCECGGCATDDDEEVKNNEPIVH